MESYIVRIYRFNKDRPEEMVGVLTVPDSDEEIDFTGLEGFWQALQSAHYNMLSSFDNEV